jgi:hypothetical protein
VRTREAYSVNRFTGFNGENMKAFFKNLFELMSRHNLRANKLCDQEENYNSSVQVSPNITCAKGIKQLGKTTQHNNTTRHDTTQHNIT